jgi:hypothetical protein
LKHSEYLLTCVSHQEAQTVIDDLIHEGLIYTAEVLDLNSNNNVSLADRVRLILGTLNASYSEIEARLNQMLKRTYKLIELPSVDLSNEDYSLPAKI